MSDGSFLVRMRDNWRHYAVVYRDVVWGAIVAVFVSAVALSSLYLADPRFHTVWEYAPHAIQSLSFVESVVLRQPVHVPGNHLTWLSVWLLHHVISSPKWIVIFLYVSATSLSALAAYGLFRFRQGAAPVAALGAVAFGLLPARFVMPNLADHWWVLIPIVMWWGMTWWDGKHTDWRQWSWHIWCLFVITILFLAFVGSSLWWWSSIVLLTSAVIASVTHRIVRPLVVAIGMVVVARLMFNIMQTIWPIPILDGDNGVRLSAIWIPLADHRIAWFAQFGVDFRALDVVHTDARYIGLSALIGVGLIVWQTLVRSAGVGVTTAIHRLLLVLGVIVIIANQRGLWVLAQFIGLDPFSSMFVDVWIAFIGIIAIVKTLQSRRHSWWMLSVVLGVMMIDHVPHTNIMHQMMQHSREIPVTQTWQQGIWFGQMTQADDVVAITGVGAIEPGYGRWSDADQADYVEILLAEPIVPSSFTLEIRARGVGVNIGAPVIVQIGDEQQSMILSSAVYPYRLTFTNADGNTIRVYPQPVKEPPPGDSRRIGVLLQSIRVLP